MPLFSSSAQVWLVPARQTSTTTLMFRAHAATEPQGVIAFSTWAAASAVAGKANCAATTSRLCHIACGRAMRRVDRAAIDE
jgi:hypothetical protein